MSNEKKATIVFVYGRCIPKNKAIQVPTHMYIVSSRAHIYHKKERIKSTVWYVFFSFSIYIYKHPQTSKKASPQNRRRRRRGENKGLLKTPKLAQAQNKVKPSYPRPTPHLPSKSRAESVGELLHSTHGGGKEKKQNGKGNGKKKY